MEVHFDDVKEFIYNKLIERGLVPSVMDVEEITEVFGELLVDLGLTSD